MTLEQLTAAVHTTLETAPRFGDCYVLTPKVVSDMVEAAHTAGRNYELALRSDALDRVMYPRGNWPWEPATTVAGMEER